MNCIERCGHSRHPTLSGVSEGRCREPYSPINFPRISFMSSEHGTQGHEGSSAGTGSPQMSLFGDEGDDRK